MPEPILVSIAAALAGKASVGLYGLATRKFARDPKGIAEIEAAVEAPEGPSASRCSPHVSTGPSGPSRSSRRRRAPAWVSPTLLT